MKFSVVVHFASLCLVISNPIKEQRELEVVDNTAPIADATKGEKLPIHDFIPKLIKSKQLNTVKHGARQEGVEQKYNGGQHEVPAMMLNAEAVRQEHDKQEGSTAGELQSPEAERVEGRNDKNVSQC